VKQGVLRLEPPDRMSSYGEVICAQRRIMRIERSCRVHNIHVGVVSGTALLEHAAETCGAITHARTSDSSAFSH